VAISPQSGDVLVSVSGDGKKRRLGLVFSQPMIEKVREAFGTAEGTPLRVSATLVGWNTGRGGEVGILIRPNEDGRRLLPYRDGYRKIEWTSATLARLHEAPSTGLVEAEVVRLESHTLTLGFPAALRPVMEKKKKAPAAAAKADDPSLTALLQLGETTYTLEIPATEALALVVKYRKA
jgi:hypothetical protein